MAETEKLVRETGIDLLGSVVWGTHVCLFYRTKEDLSNILVPYFKAGLENNEFCMWITCDPLNSTEAKNAIREAMPDFDKYLKKGQIEIIPHDQWYLDQGIFDKERVIKGWMDKLSLALNNGYAGLRMTGNTSWLNEKFWDSFIEYEHQVNETIDRLPIIAVCTYRLDGCGTSEIVDVVNNHQLALIEKEGRWKLAKNAERQRAEKRAREYQAQLKSLASELTLVEEHERHRLATDLHDQISQALVISKIKLEALRKSGYGSKLDKALDDVCNSIGRTIQNTRTLTFGLSSPVLYELGFEMAVSEWLTNQIQGKHGIAVEFETDGKTKSLDDDICILLFRDVRELLTNVVEHARAHKVKVSINRLGEQISIAVEDDGVGFDSDEIASGSVKRGEFGLFSIRERLERVGGHLEIESKPGSGCRIKMMAPLKKEKIEGEDKNEY